MIKFIVIMDKVTLHNLPKELLIEIIVKIGEEKQRKLDFVLRGVSMKEEDIFVRHCENCKIKFFFIIIIGQPQSPLTN